MVEYKGNGAGSGGEPGYLMSKDQLRAFVAECRKDRQHLGADDPVIKEGEKLAKNLRLLLPEVTDKDAGQLLVSFVHSLIDLADCPAMVMSDLLNKTMAAYAYAAADLIGSALDVDDMTS